MGDMADMVNDDMPDYDGMTQEDSLTDRVAKAIEAVMICHCDWTDIPAGRCNCSPLAARAAIREVAEYLESVWPDDIPEGDCTCKDCKEFWHGLTPTKVAKHLRSMCKEATDEV